MAQDPIRNTSSGKMEQFTCTRCALSNFSTVHRICHECHQPLSLPGQTSSLPSLLPDLAATNTSLHLADLHSNLHTPEPDLSQQTAFDLLSSLQSDSIQTLRSEVENMISKLEERLE